jgi:hypothetical protein
MQLTNEILQTAMRKAMEHGLLPRYQSSDLYAQNLAAMKDILQATLEAADKGVDPPLPKLAATDNAMRSDYAVFRSGNRAAYVPGIIGKQQ